MNDREYEPMDIDSSSNSYTAMEISYNEIINEDIQKNESESEKRTEILSSYASVKPIKKFNINMKSQRGKKYTTKLQFFFCILFLASLFLAIIGNKVFNINCCSEIELEALKYTLTSKVYGQSKAIENFVQALETKDNTKMLFMYGGTGVGKTLSVSILLQKLLNYSNIFHYTMPSFVDKFTTELIFSMIFCDKWIIIVDDLNLGDKHVKPILEDVIEKSEKLKKKVTIILVYNCDNKANVSIKCDNSFTSELLEKFKDIMVTKHFIRFMPLTEDSLKQCIVNELEYKLIDKIDMNKLMKNFNVTNDGCKSVYTKVRSMTTYWKFT